MIAGAQAPGTDWAHYAYIAADAALLVLLVALAADTVRRLLPATAAAPRQPVDACDIRSVDDCTLRRRESRPVVRISRIAHSSVRISAAKR